MIPLRDSLPLYLKKRPENPIQGQDGPLKKAKANSSSSVAEAAAKAARRALSESSSSSKRELKSSQLRRFSLGGISPTRGMVQVVSRRALPKPNFSILNQKFHQKPRKPPPPTPLKGKLRRSSNNSPLEKKFRAANRVITKIGETYHGSMIGAGNFNFAVKVCQNESLRSLIKACINATSKEAYAAAQEAFSGFLENNKDVLQVDDATPVQQTCVLKAFKNECLNNNRDFQKRRFIDTHMGVFRRACELGIPVAQYYNKPNSDLFYMQEYLPLGFDNLTSFREELATCKSIDNLSAKSKNLLDQITNIIILSVKGKFPLDASADGGNFRIRQTGEVEEVVLADFYELVDELDEWGMRIIDAMKILSRGCDQGRNRNPIIYNHIRDKVKMAFEDDPIKTSDTAMHDFFTYYLVEFSKLSRF